MLLAVFSVCVLFHACEEGFPSSVGMGIQPEEDKIAVFDTTLYITASTVKTESVYAKTVTGYLGEFYDPIYGSVKAGYASQFYPANFYPDEMVTGKIDSVRLSLYYLSIAGDPYAPMEVTVYPINKPLQKHYYSNIDPAEFCDMDNPIISQSYVAKNPLISDSLLNAGYYRMVSIPLPIELGEQFLEEFKKPEPNAFSSVDAFTKFFPGFYMENSFGKGSILEIDYTRIHVYYQRYYETTSTSTGNDTTLIETSSATFNVTKEVIQMNSIQSANDDILLQPDNEKSYIKSPNGVFTKISIPLKEITEKLEKRKFSGISLTLKAFPQEESDFPLSFPGMGIIGNSSSSTSASRLLLIEPDSVKNFFESQQVADGQTSYTTTFDTNTYSYTFSNISNIVQNAIDNAPEKETLDLLLIPVRTSFSYQQNSYYASPIAVDYTTAYYLFPAGVTLKTDKESLKVRILANSLEINQ